MASGSESARPRVVVVGYDGSPASRAALDLARRRAAPDGQVVAVYGCGLAPEWHNAPGYDRILEEYCAHGRRLLSELSASSDSGQSGLAPLQTELVHQTPGPAVATVARDRLADEIVLGSGGFNQVRAGLGSVARQVLHLADRPVTVIPEAALKSPGGSGEGSAASAPKNPSGSGDGSGA